MYHLRSGCLRMGFVLFVAFAFQSALGQSVPNNPVPATPQPTTPPAYQDPLEQPLNLSKPAAPSPAPAPVPSTPALPAPNPVVPVPPSAAPTTGLIYQTPPPNYLPAYVDPQQSERIDELGSSYIPVDSPIYPMAMRLYSLGYLDTAFIGMKPWTRRSLLHMLNEASADIEDYGSDEAIDTLSKLRAYLLAEDPGPGFQRGYVTGVESVYSRLMGVKGQTLRDSYHLGQTLVNDYGRPYEPGFNNVTGFTSVNEWGRFSLYARGEYQHSPAGPGYSLALASSLSCSDFICPFASPNAPQDTIPYGNTGVQNPFRLQEAALSFHVLGHEISGGKTDDWTGPALGGAFGWSNNAENIYSFRINRVEPLNIPLFSKIFGPIRYDFFVGSLKGHTQPNDPWVHQEQVSLRPYRDFEISFQRTVIWGGKGHEPVTLHTFFRSFFDINDTTAQEKESAADPGARFTAFDFSWRLPFLRRNVTLYTDSESHDDVTPVSAPRRAAFRPGIVLSQLPYLPRLELRVEGFNTDPGVRPSMLGHFQYFEDIQNQGYTNKGFIFGDWAGREGKGGQAWLTYHLSGNEWVQVEYLNKKNAKDFIAGGTTQNQFKVDVLKRLRKDIELDAWVQYESWKAPIYKTGSQSDTVFAGQVTFYPKLHTANRFR